MPKVTERPTALTTTGGSRRPSIKAAICGATEGGRRPTHLRSVCSSSVEAAVATEAGRHLSTGSRTASPVYAVKPSSSPEGQKERFEDRPFLIFFIWSGLRAYVKQPTDGPTSTTW